MSWRGASRLWRSRSRRHGSAWPDCQAVGPGSGAPCRSVACTTIAPAKRTPAATVIASAGDAAALMRGAATTAPSIVVRQIVEPTPKTRPWCRLLYGRHEERGVEAFIRIGDAGDEKA
jgi:hypothetical protein